MKLERYESNSNNTDRAQCERIGRSKIFLQMPGALPCVCLAVHGESLRTGTVCSIERVPVAQQPPQLHRQGGPRDNDGLAIPRLRRGGNVRGNGSVHQVVNASL